MRKMIAFCAVLPVLAGLCTTSYADDTVSFYTYVESNGAPVRLEGDISSTAPGMTFVEGSNRIGLKYTVTNLYKKDDVISYQNRQRQTGTIQVWWSNPYITPSSYVRCEGTFEHDFWMENESNKHDRFFLTLTKGDCTINHVNAPSNPDSGLKHDGDKYIITVPEKW